ncbi:MAG: penicillin-binding protein 1C [Thermoflexales bacterium]|nr:penicillin-binding protein 1C [Thermoflexales bacterium]
MRWRRAAVFVGFALLALPIGACAALWLSLPSVTRLYERAPAPSTKILDRHGRLLFEIFDPRAAGRHAPLSADQLPRCLRLATLAVEDARFYEHPGVDVIGVLRALWTNLRSGEVVAGGSTITQQVARMLLLEPEARAERTLWRKTREALLAWQITQRYTKDEVLALYLNAVYYGNLAYGAEAAAQAYFGKPARALSLGECALLAGLTQAPASYDPFTYPERALARQRIVLQRMAQLGYVSAQEAEEAARTPLRFAPAPFAIRAPHFVNLVRQQLEEQLGTEALLREGLIVTTTLDLTLNEAVVAIIRTHLEQLNDRRLHPAGHNVRNAAVVVLDVSSGEILALVGSPNYFDASISGAVNAALALRQPGSAIKPIVYAAAFAHLPRFTAATPLFDVRTAFPTREGLPYVPINYDGQHRGPISAREALATSNNVAAVSVLQQVGVERVVALAHALGIASLRSAEHYGLALALGSGEVRLLELTAAYAAFANAGRRVTPVAIREVRDAQGRLRWQARPADAPQVVDARIAWLISDILADPLARASTFGEFSVLRLARPAAVKTGTTTDFRDNWTVGYTPHFAVGVWVGNADGEPMRNVSGVSGAAPIWRQVMQAVHQGVPAREFPRPLGLVQAEVCVPSGLLPTPECPYRRREWFIAGTAPTQFDTWHRRVKLDARTGRLADVTTPPAYVIERVALDVPPALRAWARAQGWLLFDELAAHASGADAQQTLPLVRLLRPDNGATYRLASELPEAAQRVPVEALADSTLVASVRVLLGDGSLVAQAEGRHLRATWQLRRGEHWFVAEARLRDGRIVRSAPARVVVR